MDHEEFVREQHRQRVDLGRSLGLWAASMLAARPRSDGPASILAGFWSRSGRWPPVRRRRAPPRRSVAWWMALKSAWRNSIGPPASTSRRAGPGH